MIGYRSRENTILDTPDMIYPTSIFGVQRPRVILRHDDYARE